MTLNQIPPGGRCRIRHIVHTNILGKRLLSMGVYPGMTLSVIRNAPLGDPMEILIDGIFLSLRRAEARIIEVDAVV